MQSKSNALWVIPIIINGAEESACDVIRCTSICLGCSRKRWDRRWDAVVQPISNGFLQDSGIKIFSIFDLLLEPWNERVQELNYDVASFTAIIRCCQNCHQSH